VSIERLGAQAIRSAICPTCRARAGEACTPHPRGLCSFHLSRIHRAEAEARGVITDGDDVDDPRGDRQYPVGHLGGSPVLQGEKEP
jgi:hypothetical protein